MPTNQIEILRKKSNDFSDANALEVCKAFEEKFSLLLIWLDHFSTCNANDLRNVQEGILSSIKESIGCACIGLIKPSLMALRSTIDLSLGWLYFKDHHIEWHNVNQTGAGFKLKQEIIKYLGEYVPCFNGRLGILTDIGTRKSPDPYRLLSAHIHGQSEYVIPNAVELSDIVGDKEFILECASLAFDVSEYLNDVFISSNFWSWNSLPNDITKKTLERFKSEKQRKAFFNRNS